MYSCMFACLYICVYLFVLSMQVFEHEFMDEWNNSREIICIGMQYLCICKFIEILYLAEMSRIWFDANIYILTYTSKLCNDLCFKKYI